ncbi:MAG: sporulation protein YabP [bacterium]|jgi:sporulation protein YabP
MAEDKNGGDYRHQLTLTNREICSIKGVGQVISFDDAEIVLDTEMGVLTVSGEEMHIKQLDLDKGIISIDGLIRRMEYADNVRSRGGKGKGKGLLERLLK